MPEAPSTSLFTQHVLENPWPLGLTLLAIALVVAWLGLREGLPKRVRIAAVLGVIGAIVISAGMLVTTSGEHGERITRQLVEAAVSKDVVGGMNLFSDDAVLNVGKPTNPGFGYDEIQLRFADFAEYNIESNRITRLEGYSVSSDEAEVHLACLTTAEGFGTVSRWVVAVRRESDGQWKVSRLTCVSINDRTPPLDRIR